MSSASIKCFIALISTVWPFCGVRANHQKNKAFTVSGNSGNISCQVNAGMDYAKLRGGYAGITQTVCGVLTHRHNDIGGFVFWNGSFLRDMKPGGCEPGIFFCPESVSTSPRRQRMASWVWIMENLCLRHAQSGLMNEEDSSAAWQQAQRLQHQFP